MISLYIFILTAAIIIVGLFFIFKMNQSPQLHKAAQGGRHLSRSNRKKKSDQ